MLDGFQLTGGQRDPSKRIPNHAPPARSQVWRECEIASIAKRAWRDGYTGLPTFLVILWEGMMSPVDARTVKASQIITGGTGRALSLARAKSGQKGIAPLTHRAWRVLTTYLRGRSEPDNSPMCRMREGSKYSKDVLSKNFRTICQGSSHPEGEKARSPRDIKKQKFIGFPNFRHLVSEFAILQ